MRLNTVRQLGAIIDFPWENGGTKGLMFGDIGYCLLYYSLFTITGEDHFKNKCSHIINDYLPGSIKSTDFASLFPTNFAYGFTGIYSALKMLSNERFDDRNLELLDLGIFDEYICESILKSDIGSDWSLFHGTTGQLYYLTFKQTLNDTVMLSPLFHICSLLESVQGTSKFRNKEGEFNISLTHGATGFLSVVLTYFRLVDGGIERIVGPLSNVIQALEEYVAMRLNTGDTNFKECSIVKKDLLVCACLTNLGVDFGVSPHSRWAALSYADILLDNLSKTPQINNGVGQHNGLSGVVECTRSLYIYSKKLKFSNWFDHFYDLLYRRFFEIDLEKHTSNLALFNGSCGALLTILHPQVEQNPAWRKLLLY